MSSAVQLSPFQVLAEYERLSLAHVAGLPDQTEAPGMWRGIGFRLGERYLLSSIDEVSEILTLPPITPVPGTRAWMLGVANVRGNLVPVVDLRGFLEGEHTVVTDDTRVLVVRQAAGSVGLLTDEVLGQRSLSAGQRSGSVVEEDERYAALIVDSAQLGDRNWGLFSVGRLVGNEEFQHAAVG